MTEFLKCPGNRFLTLQFSEVRFVTVYYFVLHLSFVQGHRILVAQDHGI